VKHYIDDMFEITSWIDPDKILPPVVQLSVDCGCSGSAHLTAERARAIASGLVAGAAAIEPYQPAGIGEDADHAALVAYLLSAVRRKDWHAVSDAANDLRVLEASRR